MGRLEVETPPAVAAPWDRPVRDVALTRQAIVVCVLSEAQAPTFYLLYEREIEGAIYDQIKRLGSRADGEDRRDLLRYLAALPHYYTTVPPVPSETVLVGLYTIFTERPNPENDRAIVLGVVYQSDWNEAARYYYLREDQLPPGAIAALQHVNNHCPEAEPNNAALAAMAAQVYAALQGLEPQRAILPRPGPRESIVAVYTLFTDI